MQACGNARLFNFCVWRSLYINQAFLQANECRAQPKIAHICSIFSGFHLDSCVSLIIANKCLLKMHCTTKTKVPNQNSIEMFPLYNIVKALQSKFNPENIKSDLDWTKSWRINETLFYYCAIETRLLNQNFQLNTLHSFSIRGSKTAGAQSLRFEFFFVGGQWIYW